MPLTPIARVAQRVFLLLVSLVASVIVTAPTSQAGIAPPPIRRAVDDNGVDLLTGKFLVSTPSIAIGPPDAGGLSYSRYWDSTVMAWRDTYQSGVNFDGARYSVTVLGLSTNFTLSGGVYSEVEPRGASLAFDAAANRYLFRGADGMQAVFDRGLLSSDPIQANEGLLISVTMPDGVVLTFDYQTITGPDFLARRLQSVRSSFGYQLKFSYESSLPNASALKQTAVLAINNAIDFCDPAVAVCAALTRSWPVLLFGTDGNNGQIVTDSLGLATRYQIESGGVVGIRFPGDATDTIALQYLNGRVSSYSDGAGVWSYQYADSGNERTTTVTDPAQRSRTVISKIEEKVVLSDRDGLNRATSYGFDGANRLIAVVAPEGNRVAYSRDGRGNITEARAVAKSGSGLADMVTSAVYPSNCANPLTCNQPTSTTDEKGGVTDYVYDPNHGGVLTITGPAPSGGQPRPEVRMSYAAQSASYKTSEGGTAQPGPPITLLTETSSCAAAAAPGCIGGADETRTIVTYGATSGANNLLPISVTTRAGSGSPTETVATTYDVVGDVVVTDGPLSGDEVHSRYDANRRLTGVISPDPDGTGPRKRQAGRFRFAATGLLESEDFGTVNGLSEADWAAFALKEQREILYDTQRRPRRENLIGHNGAATTYRVTQYTYEADSKLRCAAMRIDPAVFASLPSDACTLTNTSGAPNAQDRILKYLYTAGDQIEAIQSGLGTALAQTTQAMTYTANGRLQTLADARGNLTTYEYDGHDRLKKTRYPSPTTSGVSSATDYSEVLAFDAASSPTSERLRDGTTIANTYDALNRQTAVDGPGTAIDRTFSYDLLDRTTQISGNGRTQSYAYDALSRLTSTTGPFPGASVAYQYDAASRRSRLTWPDGYYVAYDYTVLDELTAIRENGATSGAGVLATFGYDDLGRRAALQGGNATASTYSYDTVSRLTGLNLNLDGAVHDQTYAFSYLPTGQVKERTDTNSAYAIAAPVNGTTGYTANGLNQYTAVGGAAQAYNGRGALTADGVRTYGYDEADRLTSVAGGVTASLAYAPDYMLVETTINDALSRYLYDGPDLIAELDGSNQVLRRYVHGPGLDEPLVWLEGAGTTNRRWLHADPLGSIVAVSNAAGGALQINTYETFGRPAATNLGRFQFTGQVWLPQTGLYHYKARAYHPALGRFLQPDPLGYDAGDMNLYAYVGNDPINARDPWGLACMGDPSDGIEVCAQRPRWIDRRTSYGGPMYWGGGSSLGYEDQREAEYCAQRPGSCQNWPGNMDVETVTALPQDSSDVACLSALGTPCESGAAALEFWDVPATVLGGWQRRAAKQTATAITGCAFCFGEGTLVQTPDGLRAIESIKVGDLVLAYDETTKKVEPKTVTALIRPLPKALLDVEIVGVDGQLTHIGATADHPWLAVRGEGEPVWVETIDLKPGDRLVTADGKGAVFRSATLRAGLSQTYNLEVADHHTFLVGEDGLVVHNGCFNWKDLNRVAHIFRNRSGHVNPASQSSKERFARLFERVSRDSSNLVRTDPRTGVNYYAKQYRAGGVWVQTRNGSITNAGVNR